MKSYQREFIKLAIKNNALIFGDFLLKSGRKSPYFFNAGLFKTGKDLTALGNCYAQVLMANNILCDMIFGIAYKGIPIVTTTIVALYKYYHIDKPYCFNRKEVKQHGEGGELVGSPLKGNVVIVDDVITAGTSINESVAILNKHQAKLSAVILSLDRQEIGENHLSAVQEVEQKFQCKVFAIITLNDLIDYLSTDIKMSSNLATMKAYLDNYGITPGK